MDVYYFYIEISFTVSTFALKYDFSFSYKYQSLTEKRFYINDLVLVSFLNSFLVFHIKIHF